MTDESFGYKTLIEHHKEHHREEDTLRDENRVLKHKLVMALMFLEGAKFSGSQQATDALKMIDEVKE